MLLFQEKFPRTLEAVSEALHDGETVEIWTFDDPGARRATEVRLRERGIQARVRSAYKPLLHAFLEEIDLTSVNEVVVRYPRSAVGIVDRFRLEAYPLAALVGNRSLHFRRREDEELFYQVELAGGDAGSSVIEVLAPNRFHLGVLGEKLLSPTGWIRFGGKGPGERLETDVERVFKRTIEVLEVHDWGEAEPFFEELNIKVSVPAQDLDLNVGDESVSIAEALHEDLYFSLLEVFAKKTGRVAGDRTLQPGQIVPDVSPGMQEVSVSVSLLPLDTADPMGDNIDIGVAGSVPDPARIHSVLAELGGDEITARARSGRLVRARHIRGKQAAVMISGGQHANEGTGIVGALRAGQVLARDPESHFVLSPLENPDGFALYRRLLRENPRHMHHAARYTAFGDDMEYRASGASGEPLFETAIRSRALAASGARLHVTLHGYPAHEWVRPFSGYVPAGFEKWTLPKGFFLILRHHAGWRNEAAALLEKVTERLVDLTEVLQLTGRQLDLYLEHAGSPDLQVVNGFPCMLGEDQRSLAPVVLISEYPDETIHGDAFRMGHEAQMRTALAAYEAWQEIVAEVA
jgi:hypothetical protein